MDSICNSEKGQKVMCKCVCVTDEMLRTPFLTLHWKQQWLHFLNYVRVPAHLRVTLQCCNTPTAGEVCKLDFRNISVLSFFLETGPGLSEQSAKVATSYFQNKSTWIEIN